MNKQIKLYKMRIGRLLSLKSISVAFLPFVLAVPLILPQSAQAQTQGVCSNKPDGITGEATDFYISCTGAVSDIDDDSFQSLFSIEDEPLTGYDEMNSKVTINLSNVTGATGKTVVPINIKANKTTLISSIAVEFKTGKTDDSEDPPIDVYVEIKNQGDEGIISDSSAVNFTGDGTGRLDINGSNLVGNILFTEQDDVLKVIANNVKIDGEINFGGGDDTMDVAMDSGQRFEVTKGVTGLTTITKRGQGYARFDGEVEFEGDNRVLNLREGMLVIADHMNLGDGEGTVTIYKPGKLVFEVGEKGKTGTITAHTMHFDGIEAEDASVYAVMNDELTAEKVTEAQNALTSESRVLLQVTTITSGDKDEDVETLSIKAVKANGTPASDDVGSIKYADSVGTATFKDDTVDRIVQLNPPPLPDKQSSGPTSLAGDDDNNDTILGLGLVAILVALYWGDGLFGSSFADDYAFNTPQSTYIASVDERSTLTLRESGNQPYQVWIRTGLENTMQLASVKTAGVSGTEIGLSLYRSDDFYIEASSAQDVAAQVSSLNQSAQGEVYSLSSGWQNERYFAGVKLSYGDFDTDTVIDNPVVKSTLISQSEVRHTQAQFTAGTRWNTGNLRFTPSASVQAGTFDYSAHQAQGAVVNADVPAHTQDYSALRLGFKMSASDWLSFSDDVKWKPHLQFDQIQTDSGSGGDVTLRQMDRLGALSFNSGASVQAMPEVVNAVSFGTSVKTSKSSQSEWKFGYAGLEADGEYYHAAVAAYQLRF